MLTLSHWLVMRKIRDERQLDLRRYSEAVRQRAIDLAMREPPYVDIDADRVFLTEAGVTALDARDRA
jgi:hypothetical protein